MGEYDRLRRRHRPPPLRYLLRLSPSAHVGHGERSAERRHQPPRLLARAVVAQLRVADGLRVEHLEGVAVRHDTRRAADLAQHGAAPEVGPGGERAMVLRGHRLGADTRLPDQPDDGCGRGVGRLVDGDGLRLRERHRVVGRCSGLRRHRACAGEHLHAGLGCGDGCDFVPHLQVAEWVGLWTRLRDDDFGTMGRQWIARD